MVEPQSWQFLILNWGGFGFVALLFYLFMLHDWKRQDRECAAREAEREAERKARSLERDLERDERERITTSFLESLNAHNQTVANHLSHQEVEFKRVISTLERVDVSLATLERALERVCERL